MPTGSLCALLGPSGSGKTTLLRIIAGLEVPDAGNVFAHDDEVTHRNARERDMGFVFQHYALFRHMTVFDNVAFPLRIRGWSHAKMKERAMELLHLVRLEGLEHRLPSELSGGQRQARRPGAGAGAQPRVLLLDEPFGALDAKVRLELRQWLRRFHKEIGVTTILVTHDQEEAFEVADQVVVMRQGKIEQAGSPQQIFDHPASAFVMEFLGHVNIFHGRMEQGKAVLGDQEPHGSDAGRGGDFVLRSAARAGDRTHARRRLPGGAGAAHQPRRPDGCVQLSAPSSPAFPSSWSSPASGFAELSLLGGQTVYVHPRQVRYFEPDYTI